MPAAAVIPAPMAYIKVVAFKTLVVEVCSWVWYFIAVCSCVWLVRVSLVPHGSGGSRCWLTQTTTIAIYSLLLLAAD